MYSLFSPLEARTKSWVDSANQFPAGLVHLYQCFGHSGHGFGFTVVCIHVIATRPQHAIGKRWPVGILFLLGRNCPNHTGQQTESQYCRQASFPPVNHSGALYPPVNGKPFSRHSRIPPSMEATFVYPIFCRASAASADRNPPPQYKISGVPVSGTRCSTSRSIIPLPRCMADGRWSFAHSLSSRTSMRRKSALPSSICFTSSTVTSRTRCLAVLTTSRNRGE